jgi:uncharacterized protein (TIGR00369 family)
MSDQSTASPSIVERLRQRAKIGLPGYMGIQVIDGGVGFCRMTLPLTDHHVAPNGYLHAGTVVTLADTACGFGCMASLPEGANGFTTIELKSNFLGTTTQGTLHCEARMEHGGRRTQVWDATVLSEEGKRLAIFRCTQMVLYPKRAQGGQANG